MIDAPRTRYLAALRQSMETGTSLAAECYMDPAAYDLELEHVLRPGWHAVARWDALPTPGDYEAIDLCGEPLVLVRDEQRRLRVFSRVCRHRGHTVVEGRGNAKRLICPYHRWAYGLDGTLEAAPLMRETPGFDRATCGLPELPTEVWQGFVLTNLDPAAAPIGPALGPLTERLAPLGLAEMVDVGSLEFDSPWNWKVMVENFMESYHHLGPHASSLHQTNPAQHTGSIDLGGPFSLLDNPGAGGAPSFLVFQVFPTLLGFALADGNVGGWWEMRLETHDRFRLYVHSLLPPNLAGDPAVVEMTQAAARDIHVEDIAVCEGVQRGLASRLYRPALLAHHEGCLVRFHRQLAERLDA